MRTVGSPRIAAFLASAALVLGTAAAAHGAAGDVMPAEFPDGFVLREDAYAILEASLALRSLDAALAADADLGGGVIDDAYDPPVYRPNADGAVNGGDAVAALFLAVGSRRLLRSVSVEIRGWRDGSVPDGGATPLRPAEVVELRFALGGVGMDAQSRATAAPAGAAEAIVEVFELPGGAPRRIVVEARDGSNSVVYRALRWFHADGLQAPLDVAMVPVSDATAPVFAGALGAEALGFDIARLSWPAATDNVSGPDALDYLVHQAESAEALGALPGPTYVVPRGVTEWVVPGLEAGSTVYFDVRAVDEAGNEATLASPAGPKAVGVVMPGRGEGLWVDSRRGADGPGCGAEAAPCRTITHALALSPGDEPLYLAAETFGEASGEVFPLRLKQGTRLVGRMGAVFFGDLFGRYFRLYPASRIELPVAPSPAFPAAVEGSDRNVVVGVRLATAGSNSNYAFLADAGGSMTVVWSEFAGRPEGPGPGTGLVHPGTGVILSGASGIWQSRLHHFDVAIREQGADVRIVDNVVYRSNVGINPAGTRALVVGNRAAYASSGILATNFPTGPDVGAEIRENESRDNTNMAVNLQGAEGTRVRRNRLHRSPVGVGVTNFGISTPIRILDNAIEANGTGVWINVGDADLHGNRIRCNDYYGLHVRSVDAIDASHNSWDKAPPGVWNANEDDQCTFQTPVEVCYAGTYAGTPAPATAPAYVAPRCP